MRDLTGLNKFSIVPNEELDEVKINEGIRMIPDNQDFLIK
jgi:hypothetical protein